MPITALPTPPTREDAANFSARADDFVAALPTFGVEANALATEVNDAAAAAASSASAASTSASDAATSASNAATSASNAATSATNAATSEANAATLTQNIQNANYTLVLGDRGKHVLKNSTSAYTWTIPPNSSVAFPIGTTIVLVNDGTAGAITIAQGSGVTLRLAGASTTGNRSLAAYGQVTLLKIGTDKWTVGGVGLS